MPEILLVLFAIACWVVGFALGGTPGHALALAGFIPAGLAIWFATKGRRSR